MKGVNIMIAIANVKHLKGRTQEGYTATATIGDKSVHVVFNCITKNLIIHKWYKLTSDECDAVEAFASHYFCSLAA